MKLFALLSIISGVARFKWICTKFLDAFCTSNYLVCLWKQDQVSVGVILFVFTVVIGITYYDFHPLWQTYPADAIKIMICIILRMILGGDIVPVIVLEGARLVLMLLMYNAGLSKTNLRIARYMCTHIEYREPQRFTPQYVREIQETPELSHLWQGFEDADNQRELSALIRGYGHIRNLIGL